LGIAQGIAQKFRISQVKAIAYHPQSNGSKEAITYRSTLNNTWRNREWDEYVKLVIFSYNTRVHENTKLCQLLFGKSARIPTNDPVQQAI